MAGWDNPCEDFPRVERLWRGVVLGTIAEVICGSGEVRRWDGPTFVIDPMSGDNGAVTFDGHRVVGVFFNHNSERNPWPEGRPPYDISPYLAGMPADLHALAVQHALPHMVEKWDASRGSVITAAFWSAGAYLTAAEPWPDLWWQGVHVLRLELLEPEDAIAAWRSDYDLSPAQVALIRRWCERWQAAGGPPVAIEQDEWGLALAEFRVQMQAWWQHTGEETSPHRLQKLEQERTVWARSMLRAVGIVLL